MAGKIEVKSGAGAAERERNPEPERIVVPIKDFAFKAAGDRPAKDGEPVEFVEGYASVFGDLDSVHDIVEKGAFTKTLQERLPGGQIKFFEDHWHDSCHLLGTLVEGTKEDSLGLFIRAKCSAAPSAQDTLVKAREGHLDRLSIGYRPIRETFESDPEDVDAIPVRHLEEVKLYEVSLVPFPALESAVVTAVKSVPFEDLPLAPADHPWDPAEALKRVRAWAQSKAGVLLTNRFRTAFLWYDRMRIGDVDGYKMNLCDVVNGELHVIPKALEQAIREHEKHVPAEAVPMVRRNLDLYAKALREAGDVGLYTPWAAGGTLERLLACSRFMPQDVGAVREKAATLCASLPDDVRRELLTTAKPDAAKEAPKDGAAGTAGSAGAAGAEAPASPPPAEQPGGKAGQAAGPETPPPTAGVPTRDVRARMAMLAREINLPGE